ncbi:hypothetical protein ACFL2E_12640, partial [Thermodesulfobacteriota bacterium]
RYFREGQKLPNADGGQKHAIHDEWDHLLVWHVTSGTRGSADSGWNIWDYGDADPVTRTNVSYIGNVFRRFSMNRGSEAALGSDYLDSGNSNGNEALYNHFMTGTTYGENSTTGTGVINFDTPGSASFGSPRPGSVIVDRLPSNLTGVMCDALGKPRGSRSDVGALEANPGPQTPQGFSIIDSN